MSCHLTGWEVFILSTTASPQASLLPQSDASSSHPVTKDEDKQQEQQDENKQQDEDKQ